MIYNSRLKIYLIIGFIYMSSYLAYSYIIGLTKKEWDEIDLRTKKSREEFSRGFSTGTTISLAAYFAYSVYSLCAPSAAYAIEPIVKPDSPMPEVAPAPTEVAPTQPGFKPLSKGSRGAYIGAVTTICGVASQSGDFLLGLACAGLLIVGGIVINRPHPKP